MSKSQIQIFIIELLGFDLDFAMPAVALAKAGALTFGFSAANLTKLED